MKFQMPAAAGLMAATLLATTAQAQSYDWEGAYASGFVSGAFFDVEMSDLTDTFTNDSPAVNALVVTGGVALGYNWLPRGDNLLVGLEIDVQGGAETSQLVRFNAAGTDGQLYQNRLESLASLRGRVGVVNDNLLSYVTGGISYGNANYRATDLDPALVGATCDDPGIICAEATEGLTGIAVGAGVEYAFRENATLRFEVMQHMLPTASAELLNGGTTPACSVAAADECSAFFDSGLTQIRLGVSFKF